MLAYTRIHQCMLEYFNIRWVSSQLYLVGTLLVVPFNVCTRARPVPELHGCNSGTTSFLYIFAIYAFICMVFCLFLSGVIYEPISNQSRSMKTIYNSWKIIQIQSSSRQVIEFWSSAAEAAACELLYYHYTSISLYCYIMLLSYD